MPTTQPTQHFAVWSLAIEGLRTTFDQTSWRGWLTLFLAILVGFAVGHFVKHVLNRFAEGARRRRGEVRAVAYESSAAPVALVLLTLGLSAGLGAVTMSDVVRWFAGRCLALTYIVGIGWWLFNLVDVLDLFLRRLSLRTHGNLDDQMVLVIRKALRLFLIVVLTLFTLENVFDRDVSAWLAGLGIAGLAVTLAAQDSIKNFFGSLTILFDRPFQLGDQVVIDTHQGTVIDIGFRSTRVRRTDGVMVTIPNSKVVEQSIQNISRRPNLQRTISLVLPYDAPPEQVERVIAIVNEILAEPEIANHLDTAGSPPRVFFNDMKGDTLIVQAQFWYNDPADWWGFQELSQKINFTVLRRLSEAGIKVSFPK